MYHKSRSYFGLYLKIALPFLCLFQIGCGLMHVVPVQLARISQTETYIQKFSFLNELENCSYQGVSDLIEAQNIRMDKIFKELLGPMNWQNLKDLYGLDTVRSELIEKKIYLKGLINFTIYINPVRQDLFITEGSGRYFLIREKTSEILLSGDFYIKGDYHSINELNNGSLMLDVQLFVTRVPDRITYYKDVYLKYEIFIDTSMKENQVYSIDYNNRHKVYLMENEDDNTTSDEKMIAELSFGKKGGESKLFDLRGLYFLKKDYGEKSNKLFPYIFE